MANIASLVKKTLGESERKGHWENNITDVRIIGGGDPSYLRIKEKRYTQTQKVNGQCYWGRSEIVGACLVP